MDLFQVIASSLMPLVGGKVGYVILVAPLIEEPFKVAIARFISNKAMAVVVAVLCAALFFAYETATNPLYMSVLELRLMLTLPMHVIASVLWVSKRHGWVKAIALHMAFNACAMLLGSAVLFGAIPVVVLGLLLLLKK